MKKFVRKKQSVSILLLIVMLFGLIPIDVLAANQSDRSSGTISEDSMFVYEDDNKEVIVGFKGDADTITIPNQVKKIGHSAFKDKNIKKVILNEGLKEIDNEAFSNNQILGDIVLPKTLIRIGSFAFADNLIQKVDFSKTSGIQLSESVFQDNEIYDTLDLSNVKKIPKRAFINNKISNIIFDKNVNIIDNEAFANNNLGELEILSKDIVLGKDVFAGNGRYVSIKSEVLKSEKSEYHQYGHIVNPINIIVRSIITKSDGSKEVIKSDKEVLFNPYEADNFFSLNSESFYKPEYILDHVIDKDIHKDGVVSFVPDKDYYVVDVFYKKEPNPTISVNKDAIQDLLNNKKEGSNISEEDLLSLVTAKDYRDMDITDDVVVFPKEIVNAEAKEYNVVYSVKDSKGRTTEYKLILPIVIDPLKIKIANTEWQLEDFIYEGNSVVDLSDLGKKKSETVSGLAIPHVNPYTMESIEVINFGEVVYYTTSVNIFNRINSFIKEGDVVFGDAESIREIKDASFTNVPIKDLPDMPKLEHIGNRAFRNTGISGQLPDMPNLKYIENGAFSGLKQLSGQLPDMPNLKHIGDSAFRNTGISSQLPDMPMLEYIEDDAFYNTQISGQLPDMPNLKYIGNEAFNGLKQLSGQLPDMPNLKYIGNEAFQNTGISGQLPDMPNLEYIGDNAFRYTGISGQLPDMPKLKHVGSLAFFDTNISGQLPDMPNLEYIEDNAFSYTGISGQLPDMPNLKYIGNGAFSGLKQLSGQLPDMPNLEHIGDNAFQNTGISGQLPDMPNLREIGNRVFYGTGIEKDKPFYINNDTEAGEASFQISDTDNTQLVLLTKDGKNAPGIPVSDYHVLNPKTVFFIGKNKNNETILDKTSVLAREDGSNLIITLPSVNGYIDSGDVTVPKSSLVDNTYTHIYKSYKDKVNESGGNKYQFKFIPITREGLYGDGQVINTQLSLSTVNENVLSNGKIEIAYNDNVFEDFYIPKTRGIEDINYSKGKASIILNKNLSQGTEIAIPVSFKIKTGFTSKEYPLDTILLNGDNILGYDHVSYGPLHVDPVFKSTFDKKDKRVEYKNIVTSDLSKDYSTSVTLYPSIVNFVRDFESIEVKYSGLKYRRKDGSVEYMDTQSNNWKRDKDEFTLTMDALSDNSIKPLTLDITNPAKTNEAIIIKSAITIKYKDENGELKTLTLENENELNIHPEERYGGVLSKNIRGPHYNGRHSYFHDNDIERKEEFSWNLLYRVTQDLDELTLTDHSLDNRMKFTSVDPNGKKVLAVFYENENELTRINISDKYIIDKDIQERVDKIELRYYSLNNGDGVRPIIGSRLIDPDKNYYQEGNPENINSFYNKMSTRSVGKSGQVMVGSDYAFTNVVPENKQLRTVVKITSPIEDLSYGKSSTTKFSLASKDKFNKNIKEMKYTAIIEPGYRLEDVSFLNGVVGNYDVSINKDGYTQIDFNIIDTNVSISSKENKFDLFNIVTTPEKKDGKPLIAHGLLHGSEEYEIYNKGEGVVNDLNLGDYSYSTDNAKPINGEFFSIRKLIGKGDSVGSRVTTKPGEKFFYRFEIDNSTSKDKENFELIDVLPFEYDQNNSQFSNKIDIEALKDIKLPEGLSIKYLNQSSDINISKNNIISDLTDKAWSNTPSKDTKAIKVTSYRLVSNGDLITIDIPMITKDDLKPVDNMSETINQFAYTHDTLGYKQALSNPVYQSAEVEVPKKDIKLTKISTSMGKKDGVIEGVDFILKDRGGRFVDRAATNKDGVLVFKDVPVGNYIVEESSILKGYKKRASNIIINAEDMDKVSSVFNLGEVVNERVDEFDYLLRNVEFIDDLNNINYSKLGSMYSREILSGEFNITNTDTGESKDIKINSRSGKQITLNPGKHIVEQTVTPKDNGLQYKENTIKYMFEIDKFGKIHLGTGRGDTLTGKTEVQNSIIYFPNSADYKTSTININKVDEDDKPLNGAEFTLLNINTGEETIKTTVSGKVSFTGVKPGLYSLKETKAPNGYIGSDRSEIIEVPINESKTLEYRFVNKKIVVNIHKYKVIADRISTKEMAEEIANNTKSYTDGNIIVKNIDGYYQVREVWKDNNINVNGTNFKTDSNGSTLNIQEALTINKDSVLNISNNTKIPGHYELDKIDEYIEDYMVRENFDGTIDIDIIVKPLKGSIYVSKYVIDKNNEVGNKELVNGSKYDLYVDKGKGNGYELFDNKTIENNNYLLFKDLNPLYKYKVVETFTPEGQEKANPKEYEVVLRDNKSYVETVIFRNYIELKAGSVHLNKIDGRTDQVLQGVEFELVDKHGVGVKHTTDSQGNISFEDLRYDLAPYTIKETKAAQGYRLTSQTITVTEEDILNEETFTVKNYKYNEVPKTGTDGKLPYFLLSIPLIALAYIFNRKKY